MTSPSRIRLAAHYLGLRAYDPNLVLWRDALETPQVELALQRCAVRLALVCSSRSGSEHLSHLLRAYGVSIEEHLNAVSHTMTAAAAHNTLLDAVTNAPFGNFGIKVTHEKTIPFFLTGDIPARIDSWKFICLERRNSVAQAISLVIAERTGAWRSDKLRGIELVDSDYNFFAVADALERIAWTNSRNRSLLASIGATPYIVFYEDLLANPEAVVDACASFAGLSRIGADVSMPDPRPAAPRQQKGPLNAVWEQYFRRDLCAGMMGERGVEQQAASATAVMIDADAQVKMAHLARIATARENELLHSRIVALTNAVKQLEQQSIAAAQKPQSVIAPATEKRKYPQARKSQPARRSAGPRRGSARKSDPSLHRWLRETLPSPLVRFLRSILGALRKL